MGLFKRVFSKKQKPPREKLPHAPEHDSVTDQGKAQIAANALDTPPPTYSDTTSGRPDMQVPFNSSPQQAEEQNGDLDTRVNEIPQQGGQQNGVSDTEHITCSQDIPRTNGGEGNNAAKKPTYTTTQRKNFVTTNNNVQVYDKGGVKTANQPDANSKEFRTETLGKFAVTNNGAVLRMEGANPTVTNVEESQHHTRTRIGISYVTDNHEDGAMTNNGSALPVSYIKSTQMDTIEVMKAFRDMEASFMTAQTQPLDAVEEAEAQVNLR
ncbi:hypothetical protein VNI00_009843 [Paramarasmius palmivorus]|uniref:Uncharacterized protein n=1 Tax=Paramarasmius palmivorus TaxID=297713 RepID=A0AAW0CMZ9_9AGAR